jgi:hypothetical protein
MLFSNFFVTTYICVVLLYCFFDPIVAIAIGNSKRKSTEHDDTINNTETKTKPRDIVQDLVPSALFVVVIIIALKYEIKPVITIFSTLIFYIWIAVLPYTFWRFIEYVFLKPLDFELTKYRESVLKFIAIIMMLVCREIAREERIMQIKHWLAGIKPEVADIFLMAGFTFWYFTVSFFISSFFILLLHKTVVLSNSRNNLKVRTTSDKHFKKLAWSFSLSQLVSKRIDALTQKEKWKKACYYILWLICLLADGVIVPLVLMIKDGTNAVLLGLQALVLPGFKKICLALGRNQGKSIIIISRLSLVGSLMFVYLMDKYMKLFSAQGSEVYEFICSVIIIPLLITQIIEIRRRKKDIVSEISVED